MNRASGMPLEIEVGLVIPDNVAFTAASALRGQGDREIERIERTQLYRLELDGPGESVEGVTAAFRRAEIVFNPNKHRIWCLAEVVEVDLGRPEFEAVVSDRDDDTTRLVALLRQHFGMRELRRLGRATAWKLFERDGPASKERLEWACRALLCNVHSQTAVVRRRPERIEVGETARPASNARI